MWGAVPKECEILLVPKSLLGESGLRETLGAFSAEFDVTRIHVAFPAEGRTMVSHFGVPSGLTLDQAIESWRAEVRFGIAENLEHALDQEW